jgi:hypothetical protein
MGIGATRAGNGAKRLSCKGNPAHRPTDLVCWTKLLGFTDTPAHWPTPKSPPSATSCSTSPPASPTAPSKHAYTSIKPGARQPKSTTPGGQSAPPSPNPLPLRPERTPKQPTPQQVGGSHTPKSLNTPNKIINDEDEITTKSHERPRLGHLAYNSSSAATAAAQPAEAWSSTASSNSPSGIVQA